jgi:hypothetical protein
VTEPTFPFDAVLELLELGAALDRSARASGAPAEVLAELAAAGLDLVEALDLAQRSERGTVEYSVALELAEDAGERLCRLFLRNNFDLEQLVRAG